jgi:CTP:molybdopterin cytidylyltransferase MocA
MAGDNRAERAPGTVRGLILSGGKGSRLQPFTQTGARQLVPVANKPVLFYAIEQLVAAGIEEIGIIVGDTAAEVEAARGGQPDRARRAPARRKRSGSFLSPHARRPLRGQPAVTSH